MGFVDDNEKLFDKVKDNLLPFEYWEKLSKERAASFAAFCVFRDYGSDRNIKRAVETIGSDKTKQIKNPRRKQRGIFFCRGNFLYMWGLLP
jgi:hypothetical protein